MKYNYISSSILLSVFVLSTISGSAQKPDKIPGKVKKNYVLLADYLTAFSNTDEEKVDAIYGWITHNIAYDYDRLNDDKCFVYDSPDNILKSKKALCGDYARLMVFMLEEVDIRAETVEGYLYTTGMTDTLTLNRAGHAWVVAEIDGTWKMFDPTWDAGYVGRLPIYYKPPKYKGDKVFKTDEKKEKYDSKYSKKLKAFKEKIKTKPKYEDKIGFVRDPARTWFAPSMDTFLMSHLPAVPFWQLRDFPISAEDFSKDRDQLKKKLNGESGDDYYFEYEIEKHMEMNPLDRMLDVGDQSYEFNPDNAGLKAINYFNYINIIGNKKLRKYFADAPEINSRAYFNQIRSYSDTIAQYCKIDMDNQKKNYKGQKTRLKQETKASKVRAKGIAKLGTKGLKTHDKFLTSIEKSREKIDADLVKLAGIEAKIVDKYPAVFSNSYKKPDLKPIQTYIDSMEWVGDSLDRLIDNIRSHQKNSAFHGVYQELQNVEHLMRMSNSYTSQNNFGLNMYIEEVDSMIVMKLENILKFYEKMSDREMVDKQVMTLYKQQQAYAKAAKARAKEMEVSGEVTSAAVYDAYTQKLLMEELGKIVELNKNSMGHMNWLDKNSRILEDYWEVVEEHIEDQEDLNEEKNEYMADQYEHGFNRDKDLFELMKKKSAEWKKHAEKQLFD